jgi:hypothetical protein
MKCGLMIQQGSELCDNSNYQGTVKGCNVFSNVGNAYVGHSEYYRHGRTRLEKGRIYKM